MTLKTSRRCYIQPREVLRHSNSLQQQQTKARCMSASVYESSSSSSSRKIVTEVDYLPLYHEFLLDKNDANSNKTVLVELSPFREEELSEGMHLMNVEIIAGNSWPFLDCYESIDDYCSYFHSHNSYAVRFVDQEKHGKDILGCFYIKPNFPGRCNHICNGGFITNEKYRNKGIGTFMARSYLRMAKDLGYRASFFNLVFDSNSVSIALWKKLGFRQLATIPRAFSQKDVKVLVDAHQFYYDLYGLETRSEEARRHTEWMENEWDRVFHKNSDNRDDYQQQQQHSNSENDNNVNNSEGIDSALYNEKDNHNLSQQEDHNDVDFSDRYLAVKGIMKRQQKLDTSTISSKSSLLHMKLKDIQTNELVHELFNRLIVGTFLTFQSNDEVPKKRI